MMVPPPLFRGELRRWWRGAAVGVVLGIGFAAVLTAASGARRTETAFPADADGDGRNPAAREQPNEAPISRRRLYERVAAPRWR